MSFDGSGVTMASPLPVRMVPLGTCRPVKVAPPSVLTATRPSVLDDPPTQMCEWFDGESAPLVAVKAFITFPVLVQVVPLTPT